MKGRINVEQPLSNYLGLLKNTNKEGISLKSIMAHRAGFKDWIPFFEQTKAGPKHNPKPSSDYYHSVLQPGFSTPVTNQLFLRDDFKDSIWYQIVESEVNELKDYRYSDLGFYMIARMVEELTEMPIDVYMERHFYEPMGLQSATYNPWRRLELEGNCSF